MPGSPGGRPSTPGGRPNHPLGLNSPYTLDGEEVGDATAWQLWWEFNKDGYLRSAGIHTGVTKTDGGDFYLGSGQRTVQVGGRASDATIQETIVPALMKAIEKGGSIPFVQGAMLAVAKISGEENLVAFDFVLEYFLAQGGETINQTAAVALGVLADDDNYELLAGIAADTEEGREAVGQESVDQRLRAFAAYGLGLIGQKSRDGVLRGTIVRDLVDLLEDEEAETNDVRVAAMIALGLVPLEIQPDAEVCICGKCVVEGPETSLQNQITYLMRYFTADKVYDPVVRAHTATTLARLIQPQAANLAEIKGGVTDFLIGSLQRSAKQPDVVRQSSILALGLIGDADDDAVDKWTRWALNRSAGHGDPLERRYALISLGQVGGRGGQGEEPWAGTGEVRKDLLHHLSAGKKDVKPWAGLALGVLGHELRERGQPTDSSVDLALRQVTKNARRVSDLGAYSIAAGLRRNADSADVLVGKMQKTKDADARAYAALGLGLMGAREAIEPLQAMLDADEVEPRVRSRAGIALGLLGDASVVPDLLETLEATESEPTRAAIATALGFIGDERAIESLVALMMDPDAEEATREKAVVALGFAADRASVSWRTKLAINANYRADTPTLTSSDRGGVLDLR